MKKYTKYLLVLLILFAYSQACWAVSPPQAAWKKNVTVALDLGVGMPMGWLVKETRGFRGKLSDTCVNCRAGLVLGYTGPVLSYGFSGLAGRLGLKTGLSYGFARTVTINVPEKHGSEQLTESYVAIPLVVSMAVTNPVSKNRIWEVCMGYEWDIPCFTKYQQGDQRVSDVPDALGNIFFQSISYFSAGIYAVVTCRANTCIFKSESDSGMKNVEVMRGLGGTSLVELGVGANIIEWL